MKKFIYKGTLILLSLTILLECKSEMNSICDPTSSSSKINILVSYLTKDKVPYCGIKFFPTNSPASFSNLKTNSVVETGFVLGTAPAGVSSVEISIDGGAYQTATGTTSWKFKLPTGSSTWRDSSKHTLSVRTVTNGYLISPYSEVTSIKVRKGQNKDVNGDGYPDLIVASKRYNTFQGRVYIFHSQGSKGISASSVSTANTIITGEASSDGFAFSIASGDFNGDGYADVATSADQYTSLSNTGRAYIFHSRGETGIATQSASAANSIFDGSSTNEFFGESISAGDINGDGYTDFLVGTPAGGIFRVYIFHSTGSNGIASVNASAANTILTGESGGGFGYMSSLKDVNGDGFADVVTSGIGYNSSQGRVYIFQSRGSSGIATQNATTANTIFTGETTGNSFGRSNLVEDINGDGFLDLIVGANSYTSNQGRAYIFISPGSSGFTNLSATAANTIITGETSSQLGQSILCLDLNLDGFSDCIISGHTYNSSQGRAYIFQSTNSSGIATASATAANTIYTGETVSDQFTSAIGSGDFNGDGYPDIVISSAAYNSTQGRVYVIQTNSNITSITSANTIITGETGINAFGNALVP